MLPLHRILPQGGGGYAQSRPSLWCSATGAQAGRGGAEAAVPQARRHPPAGAAAAVSGRPTCPAAGSRAPAQVDEETLGQTARRGARLRAETWLTSRQVSTSLAASPRHADTPAILTQVGAQLQQVLLERTAHEPTHAVRRALANCIAAVAEPSMASGRQWPGLMAFLQHCSQAGNAEHKEVALLLFAALFESHVVGESGRQLCGCHKALALSGLRLAKASHLSYISTAFGRHTLCPVLCCAVLWSAGEHLAPHVASVLSAIAAGASHPSPQVQTAALSVIDPVLTYVTDASVPAFHQLLGALLPCAQAALASGNEELLVQLCQVCGCVS